MTRADFAAMRKRHDYAVKPVTKWQKRYWAIYRGGNELIRLVPRSKNQTAKGVFEQFVVGAI